MLNRIIIVCVALVVFGSIGFQLYDFANNKAYASIQPMNGQANVAPPIGAPQGFGPQWQNQSDGDPNVWGGMRGGNRQYQGRGSRQGYGMNQPQNNQQGWGSNGQFQRREPGQGFGANGNQPTCGCGW